jgi:hypothetical protein
MARSKQSVRDPFFEILEGFQTTERWLDEVSNASDTHRNELGFTPKSVFEQFARRDGLYVLVEKSKGGVQYAGHLLFDRNFPRANVRQMFTLRPYRRLGAASLLLDHLRASLTQSSFISIYARVAEDLVAANGFWQKQRFYIQRSVKGGVTRNRQILVRCHELDSPQLFPTSGLDEHNPLGIQLPLANEQPMYLLDMNVLFDVQPRRLRRTSVVALFQSERLNFCRLAISSEVRDELKRNLGERNTDPMEAYIETFSCLPLKKIDESDPVLRELAEIVFPKAAKERALNANERSDLRHIITAIQHDLSGLVTNDEALLRASPKIERRFGIQVVSSQAFEIDEASNYSDETFETSEKSTLRLLSVSPDTEDSIRFLLRKLGLSGSAIASGWLPVGGQDRSAFRFAVFSNSQCVGYVTWSALTANDGRATARAAVDESDPQALEAARILLLHLTEKLAKNGACQIKVELPQRQSYLREVGVVLGFVGSPQASYLIKSILGKIVVPTMWKQAQSDLASKGGPRLPDTSPIYEGPDKHLVIHTPDGNRVHVTLDRLESLLTPALFCLPGRPAVISPVRRSYAEPLLGHSAQGTLLPQASASSYADRLYLSAPNTLKHFKRGSLMFFYESSRDGGRRQVVALARVREAHLKACDAIDVFDLKQSVLSKASLNDIGKSQMKTVTVFDNIFVLPNPVGLHFLKRIGCGDPNRLITTSKLTDEQMRAILAEGFGCG